jgi:tetratricopeptide (TPR) repeat protein
VNRILTTAFLLLLATVAHAVPRAEAMLSSRFLVRGEQAKFEIVIRSLDLSEEIVMPKLPAVRNFEIRPLAGFVQRRAGEGRRLEHFIPFVVSSLEPGMHVIPPIELSIDGTSQRTAPVEFQVSDGSDLQWATATVGNQRIRYAATFHALKNQPYVGEKQPVELKVYFPVNQIVMDWGIPDFERKGLSAWRFQPQQHQHGRVQLGGSFYYAVPYPSTASTNAAGPATLGPASLTLQLQLASMQDFSRAYAQAVKLTVPPLQLDSKPLPPGAPEGFDNAIGQFEMSVATGETEMHEGDPVTVEITIAGSGNLDALNPPKPVDTEDWKLYDASSQERGEERRELSGEVVFRQFMKPLRVQKAIPPFRLVYFDPAKGAYDTLLSDAIPLTVLPSTAPGLMAAAPPALNMPLEEMTDILGVVNANAGLLSSKLRFPGWAWQVVPALLALGLILRIGYRQLAPRLHKDPAVVARHREWRELENAPDANFYRKAGHFIERWLGDRRDPLIEEVLRRRDETSFRQDREEARVDRAERSRVLKQLRRLALPLVAVLLTLSGQKANAADDAGKLFEEGRYAEAAKAWLESGPYEQLPPDTLYNIGNAAYRMGAPGEAALYYRRALHRDSAHPESRQNLRFLERKFGSITIQRPDYVNQIARLPLGFWKGLIIAAAWAVVLGLLVFPATRRGAGIRIAAIAAFVAAPIIAACGVVGWHYYPDDAAFAPAKEQAVVVADRAIVRTDAARTAPKVIEAPAGSLCKLVTRSGEWAYVAFTNESRGWVPLVDIRPLVPETNPEAPKPRTTKGSGDNNA